MKNLNMGLVHVGQYEHCGDDCCGCLVGIQPVKCMNVQDKKQKDYGALLVEELIDNSYEQVRRHPNGTG